MATLITLLNANRRTLVGPASILALILLPLHASALEMSADQYIDYMAHQHCANQQYWEKPDQLERTLSALDQQYGIGDEDFDALDDMAVKFSQDPKNQDTLEKKVRTLCP